MKLSLETWVKKDIFKPKQDLLDDGKTIATVSSTTLINIVKSAFWNAIDQSSVQWIEKSM